LLERTPLEGASLFFVFIQEIISDGPLLRRRNPRPSAAEGAKEQRDNNPCSAARPLVDKSTKIPGRMGAYGSEYRRYIRTMFAKLAFK
jgi:hypothetical protein